MAQDRKAALRAARQARLDSGEPAAVQVVMQEVARLFGKQNLQLLVDSEWDR